MSNYSKYNVIYRLQKWFDSVPGQTFLNYAYSWGASVVILGALFKLTHLPGANIMLFIGMGTEVIVFFMSAFDRPFDKTQVGKEIPTQVTEEYLQSGKFSYEEQYQGEKEQPMAQQSHSASSPVYTGQSGSIPNQADEKSSKHDEAQHGQGSISQPTVSPVSPDYGVQQQQASPEMADAQQKYVEELEKLTETLSRVSEQSERLTRDSEEMENLNRTLTGITKVYEMQLKGASKQIGTIDQINDQSAKMAKLIERLNDIYSRMIEAMTVNQRLNVGNSDMDNKKD